MDVAQVLCNVMPSTWLCQDNRWSALGRPWRPGSLTRRAPLIGRRKRVSAAHHPGRALRWVNPTEPGANVPPRARGARLLPHHRAELPGRARHRVPVALARAVRSHRTCQAYPGWAVEAGRALARPRWPGASLGTKHALIRAGGIAE